MPALEKPDQTAAKTPRENVELIAQREHREIEVLTMRKGRAQASPVGSAMGLRDSSGRALQEFFGVSGRGERCSSRSPMNAVTLPQRRYGVSRRVRLKLSASISSTSPDCISSA